MHALITEVIVLTTPTQHQSSTVLELGQVVGADLMQQTVLIALRDL